MRGIMPLVPGSQFDQWVNWPPTVWSKHDPDPLRGPEEAPSRRGPVGAQAPREPTANQWSFCLPSAIQSSRSIASHLCRRRSTSSAICEARFHHTHSPCPWRIQALPFAVSRQGLSANLQCGTSRCQRVRSVCKRQRVVGITTAASRTARPPRMRQARWTIDTPAAVA